MIKSTSKKTVIAGLMLAIGIYLPFATSHSMGIPGTVFLPMHIPVLLCGFFSGPVFAGICGFVLPYLNSVLTGMPAAYPNAVIMSMELLTYGVVCGVMQTTAKDKLKLWYIYLSLLVAMVAGRIVYGVVAALLLFVSPGINKISAFAAVIQGLPGIIIQLAIVPQIIFAVSKTISRNKDAIEDAVSMIKNNAATCVVVKKGHIINAESSKGISHIIDLHDKNILKGSFVADTIIGKASAMILSLSGIKECYGKVVSKEAVAWLEKHKITVQYETLVDNIQNRKGDGICPMELTVKNVDNHEKALILLKSKVEELKNLNNK